MRLKTQNYFRNQVKRDWNDSGKLLSHLKSLGDGSSKKGVGVTVLMDAEVRCHDNKSVDSIF